MTVVAPPPQDELELLIKEARDRQRKRRLGAAVAVMLLAGGSLAIYSIVRGGSPAASHSRVPIPAAATGKECGVRGFGIRILSPDGRVLYREPGRYQHPNAGPNPIIRCSGSAIWAVWQNGAGMMQEAYLGARSLDGGRTWKLVFTEGMYGPKAPHQLDSYMGPWTVDGRAAYFVGWCPACSQGALEGTTSLWVTRDGGRTFRDYKAPGLLGYMPRELRVKGANAVISATREVRGLRPAHKTVTLHLS